MKKFMISNIIPILVVVLFSFMTIGYALFDENLNLNGNVAIEKPGIIEITSANILRNECSNLTNYNEPVYKGMHIEFRLSTRSSSFSATYLVTVTNNSDVSYTYTGFPVNAQIEGYDYVPTVTSTVTRADTGSVLQNGEIIESGEEITIKLKLSFSVERAQGEFTVVVNGNVSSSQDNTGSLTPAITPKIGDLRGEGIMAPFEVSVINTYKYNRNFTLTSSNENIIIVDENGTVATSFFIEANATRVYKIYLMVKEGSIFLTDQTQTNIILASNGMDNIDLGQLTLDVEKDINATDHEKPEVGNVKLQISENNPVEGEVLVSWNRIDTGGSPIVNYYIRLYNVNSGNYTTYETGNSITSYTVSNLTEGNYYAVVYGEDEAGNIGADDVSNATTANGYASRSENTNLKWMYNVTTDFSGIRFDGTSSVLINTSYETTLSLTNTWGWALPSSITVTMNGKTLTSGTDYTYDSSSGKVIINKVTGDINITASAENNQCLVEGTKVLLANGKMKKIENIDYNDLLVVYDHENGGFTYEYPIWIEKSKKADNYQKITFSDGSVLKTFGTHGIFSADANKYVNVMNQDEFHVGSKIIKFDKKGHQKIVTVKKIENIRDNIKYYYVASTRYYNIITEGFLTNNGLEFTSFLYSFNDDLTWGKERDAFLAQNDFFEYEDWQDVFPEHLFKGLRMAEAKNIYNLGVLDIPTIISKLDVTNTKEVIQNKNGENMWMVTTSDDKNIYKKKYLKKEGSYYKLKEPKKTNNFIGWLNTADNKMYKPGDKVKVIYGMHFIAKYKSES